MYKNGHDNLFTRMNGKTYLENAQKGREALEVGEFYKAIGLFKNAIDRGGGTISKNYSLRAKATYLHLQAKKGEGAIIDEILPWMRITEDCDLALQYDKNNIDAMYYKALYLIEQKEDYQEGMKALMTVYEKSMDQLKNNKKYVIPQEVYQKIIELKAEMRQQEWRSSMKRAIPLYNNITELLEVQYQEDLLKVESMTDSYKRTQKYQDDVEDLSTVFTFAMNRACSTPQGSDPPEYLCDPISFNLFHDPVVTPSGKTYEKSWLFHHLDKYGTDPLTRTKLSPSQCYPNYFLKECVDEYIKSSAQSNE